MNEFDWVDTQIDYVDDMVNEINRHIKRQGISYSRFIRNVEGAQKCFLRLISEGMDSKICEKQFQNNERYLTILYELRDREMFVVTLAC